VRTWLVIIAGMEQEFLMERTCENYNSSCSISTKTEGHVTNFSDMLLLTAQIKRICTYRPYDETPPILKTVSL
jgi:hypothetical protein